MSPQATGVGWEVSPVSTHGQIEHDVQLFKIGFVVHHFTDLLTLLTVDVPDAPSWSPFNGIDLIVLAMYLCRFDYRAEAG